MFVQQKIFSNFGTFFLPVPGPKNFILFLFFLFVKKNLKTLKRERKVKLRKNDEKTRRSFVFGKSLKMMLVNDDELHFTFLDFLCLLSPSLAFFLSWFHFLHQTLYEVLYVLISILKQKHFLSINFKQTPGNYMRMKWEKLKEIERERKKRQN